MFFHLACFFSPFCVNDFGFVVRVSASWADPVELGVFVMAVCAELCVFDYCITSIPIFCNVFGGALGLLSPFFVVVLRWDGGFF